MTWDVLWKNARIFTLDETNAVFDQGAMASKGGKIAWVGPYDQIDNTQIASNTHIIDANDHVLLPGFIDCHTHLVYAGNRAHEFEKRLEGATYAQIHAQGGGIQATMWATRKASIEALYDQSYDRLLALIQQGVTTVEIKSGYGLDLATEEKMLTVAKMLGENTSVSVRKTFLGAHACPPEYSDKKHYLKHVIEDMLPVLVEKKLVDAVDAFCENIAFEAQDLEALVQAAKHFNLPFKCHTEQLTRSKGALLCADHKALSADHLEYAVENDIKALGESGTVAVLLPGAYYFLKEKQPPPIKWFRDYQVPMALATDCNPGTSPTTSLLLMMNMGCVLWGMTVEEVLSAVTRHAAKALGYQDRGMLKVGYKADCALWRVKHPRDLVYAFGGHPIQAVYKEGKTLYECAS